jgi:hypothetical protein
MLQEMLQVQGGHKRITRKLRKTYFFVNCQQSRDTITDYVTQLYEAEFG